MAAIERLSAAKTVAVADKSGQIIRSGYGDVYTVGDTITRVKTDSYTKVEMSRETTSIASNKDGFIKFSGGVVMTTSGEFVRFPNGTTFDPPLAALPAEGYGVGRKFQSRVSMTQGSGPIAGQKGWAEQEGKIVAFEEVTVPAGTFKAYKMVTNSINMWGYRITRTVWADPKSGFAVKTIFEGRSVRGGNADKWTEEAHTLTYAKRS
jgi:hypothetical protein